MGLRKGDILSWESCPVPAAGEIKALIRVLPAAKRGPPLVEGLRMSLHAHNAESLCTLTKAVSVISPEGGAEIGRGLKGKNTLTSRGWLEVRIRLSTKMPIVPCGDHSGLR